MADINIPPFGTNSLEASALFEQRLRYREESFSRLFDPTPLDILYEKPFYGKVDIYGTPIYPSEINMVQLPGPGLILALDFVAAAFRDFKHFIDKCAVAKGKSFADLFPSFTPKSATQNFHQMYNDHFVKNVFNVFSNSYIQVPKINRKIKNFDDLTREFLQFAKMMVGEFPITKTGFIVSPHCTNAISGLFIELSGPPYDNDLVKFERFISKPSFNDYIKAASGFGFYVDKNIPWRIAVNMDSPVTKDYMTAFGVSLDDNSVFSSYFYESEYFSYESMKARLFNLYSILMANPRSRTYGSVYETKNCPIATWDSVLNGNYKIITKETQREPIPVYYDQKEIPVNFEGPPPETFDKKYNDEYFLPIYFQLRLAESKIRYRQREYKSHMRKILNFYKVFGAESAVSYIGHLTKQTKIYEKIPDDRKPPYNIKYFGDSTSSGLYSYAEPAIIKKEKISDPDATEY